MSLSDIDMALGGNAAGSRTLEPSLARGVNGAGSATRVFGLPFIAVFRRPTRHETETARRDLSVGPFPVQPTCGCAAIVAADMRKCSSSGRLVSLPS